MTRWTKGGEINVLGDDDVVDLTGSTGIRARAANQITRFIPKPTVSAPARSAAALDAKIHVSFPHPPDAHPVTSHWHAQLSHFVHQALVERFGERVLFTPWTATPPLRGSDALVTFSSHPVLARWKRSVVVEKDDFSTDRWRHAAFRRFGFNVPLDDHRAERRWLEGQFGLVILSNDVALGRVIGRDPFVTECFDWLRGAVTRLIAYPHPIDKSRFAHDPGSTPPPDRARMLVHHTGLGGNSPRLIEMLRTMGFQENDDYAVMADVGKTDAGLMNFPPRRFLIVANTSYAETGPINMIECLLSGHLIFGHEDWWDGGGDPRLTWTHDPSRQDVNADNLDHLLRGTAMPDLLDRRDRLWRWWMERVDNDWTCVTDALIEQVEALLTSHHPAFGRPGKG